MTGDGNGWVVCSRGHRHWGRFGAAGLLVTDGVQVLLQHRAAWTHEGGTWAVPGGARDSHEDALTAALRETTEETDLDPRTVRPVHEWRDDHGGWAYTTVVATVSAETRSSVRRAAAAPSVTGSPITVSPITVSPINEESTEVRWWAIADVAGLPLHRGFAAAWPSLRPLLSEQRLS